MRMIGSHNILLATLLLFLLIACSPINYRNLADNPDRSIVYIKKALSGELNTWNKIEASFSKIDGKAPGLFANHDIAYLLPGKHALEVIVFASLEFDQ
jgi:hypothetical protein